MDRQTVKKHLDVMIAFVEGKEIEFCTPAGWSVTNDPIFLPHGDYRVKPEALSKYFIVTDLHILNVGYDTREEAQNIIDNNGKGTLIKMREVDF